MKKTITAAWILTLLLFMGGANAQPPDRSSSGQAATGTAKQSIAAITEKMKPYKGYFDFFYDESNGKLFLKVERFDEEFLYFSSLSNGAGRAAERGRASARVAKFIRMGPKVLLVEPNYGFRAITDNADEVEAVENAFAKSVLWGFVPVAQDGSSSLIDITPFIVRDALNVASGLASGSARPGGTASRQAASSASYRVDESRSAVFLPNTKNFPKNTEFEALLTFTGASTSSGRGFGGGSSDIAPDINAITLNLHQSFVELPEPGYELRAFDPRSGFNQFSFMDFSAPMSVPLVKRYIRRHRLQKKDPTASLSEPIKPIVYYIDRGAPEPIKRALIEGGAWWNEAFEAAGFKNAFQVKELPEGADPMDIRYNVVNWVNRAGNPRAFSYGSSYSDPRTGEIIKGVVTLGADRHRQDYLIAEGLLQPYEQGKPIPKEMEEMALARIRQLSAHEIGHTLGFTHNFAASPKDRASVMDYPFPRAKLNSDGSIDLSDAYAKGIGSWDIRAVIWGYSQFPKGANEADELDKIMKETLAQGHQYIPDIGGYTHPVSHQWDDGTDPLEAMKTLMKVRRTVLDRFSEKSILDGEPLTTIHEVLVPIYLLHRYQVEAVAKSVGGLYFTHAVKNDGQVPTQTVDPKRQWEALDLLLGSITPEALALPEKLIQMIPPRPSGYPASMETFRGNTGPTFDPLAAAESAAALTVSSILDPQRAARLIEYNGRDAKQPGFAAVVDKLIEQTWAKGLPNGYYGDLQAVVNNQVVKYLLELAAGDASSDLVKGQALLKIAQLKALLQQREAGSKDAAKANILFGLAQIAQFEKDPSAFKPAASAEMPPGAPIMPSMDFLMNDHEWL